MEPDDNGDVQMITSPKSNSNYNSEISRKSSAMSGTQFGKFNQPATGPIL